jgi:hypothetical protein
VNADLAATRGRGANRRCNPGTTRKEELHEPGQLHLGPDDADLRTWVREGLGTEPQWWRELATCQEEGQELWAQRAAILEVDGGLVCDEVEQQAFALLADL